MYIAFYGPTCIWFSVGLYGSNLVSKSIFVGLYECLWIYGLYDLYGSLIVLQMGTKQDWVQIVHKTKFCANCPQNDL